MTKEQLEAVRAEKWRQKANPVLTQEDAETWISATGVSLFLPRQAQLHAPAPSFVEAVLGETSATPPPSAIQTAFHLAQRLFAAESAIPLNLFGSISEQPDFLVSPEALPFVFALRGDREWKRGPRDKSTPLVIETWKLLKREGVVTVAEMQSLLGREVTEAAVFRGLAELWTNMRVLPVYVEGEATSWELFEARQQKAMQTGAGMAQGMALSALVSLYLESVVAATADDVEAFLSPLTPRSRIRDAVRGLEATRQLSTQQLGPQPIFYITGALPEFPEIAAPAEETTASPGRPAFSPPPFAARPSGSRKPFGKRENTGEGAPERPRKPFRREEGERPARRTFGSRPAAGGPRKEWKPREQQGEFRPRRTGPGGGAGAGGFKKPFRKREDGEGASRPWQPRREGSEAGFRPGASGERREGGASFRPRRTEGAAGAGGFKKPFRKREDGEGASRPWQPRREGSAAGPRPGAGEQRREGGAPFRPRRAEGAGGAGRGGFKKPFSAGSRSGDRPPRREGERPSERREWKPRRESGGGERREFRPRSAEGKPFGNRPQRPAAGGKFQPRDRDQSRPPRREWKPRPEGAEGRPPRPRRDGESAAPRREFKPRSTGPRSGGSERPRRDFGDFAPRRKSFGEGRPAAKRPFERKDRPAGEFAGERRPARTGSGPASRTGSRTGSGTGSGRPPRSFSKGTGRPAGKFGSKPGKFGGNKPSFGAKSGPKSGPKRPGGTPPFTKRKKKSEE